MALYLIIQPLYLYVQYSSLLCFPARTSHDLSPSVIHPVFIYSSACVHVWIITDEGFHI